jgi:hypothetical protein
VGFKGLLGNVEESLTVKQLFNPDEYEFDEKVNFEVIIQPSNNLTEEIDKIYWWTK